MQKPFKVWINMNEKVFTRTLHSAFTPFHSVSLPSVLRHTFPCQVSLKIYFMCTWIASLCDKTLNNKKNQRCNRLTKKVGKKLTTERVIFYTKTSQIEKLFQKKARLKNHFLASLKGNRGVCNISRLFNPIQVDGQIPGSWKVPPYPTTPAQQQSRIWTEERNIDNNYWLKLIERLCGSVLPVFVLRGLPHWKSVRVGFLLGHCLLTSARRSFHLWPVFVCGLFLFSQFKSFVTQRSNSTYM